MKKEKRERVQDLPIHLGIPVRFCQVSCSQRSCERSRRPLDRRKLPRARRRVVCPLRAGFRMSPLVSSSAESAHVRGVARRCVARRGAARQDEIRDEMRCSYGQVDYERQSRGRKQASAKESFASFLATLRRQRCLQNQCVFKADAYFANTGITRAGHRGTVCVLLMGSPVAPLRDCYDGASAKRHCAQKACQPI